jgi:hypothetical protein
MLRLRFLSGRFSRKSCSNCSRSPSLALTLVSSAVVWLLAEIFGGPPIPAKASLRSWYWSGTISGGSRSYLTISAGQWART